MVAIVRDTMSKIFSDEIIEIDYDCNNTYIVGEGLNIVFVDPPPEDI